MPSLMHDVDAAVEAFEAARAEQNGVALDLRDFAPPADHPHYAEIVVELIRVDLEYGWASSDSDRLQRYCQLFPTVFGQQECLTRIAFEEFRLRQQQGERVDPQEYEARYGIDASHWPSVTDSDISTPFATQHAQFDALRSAAPQFALSLEALEHEFPALGATVWDFQLEEELGRGAFGRVYLARQQGLADRRVALKVTARSDEPRQLAQLQHTNVVPIYSMHTQGALQAICMPFLGRTTLDQLVTAMRGRPTLPATGREFISTVGLGQLPTTPDVREPNHPTEVNATEGDGPASQDRTFADYAAWIVHQLAEGLAHAHRRGVIHCDLKPANVLLGDDGQPLILDFNVARSAQRHSPVAGLVGGTLPYMSPEQMQAFERGGDMDARSDVYALGVILFELLTGKLPFPVHAGRVEQVIATSLADRQQTLPNLRALNPAVSPGLSAIVAKCLAYWVEERYASATALAEDLQRHLENRPLRHVKEPSWRERFVKWTRRHPRLASSSTVGAVAALLLLVVGAGWMVREDRLAGLQARDNFQRVRSELAMLWAALDDDSLETGFGRDFDERSSKLLSLYAVDEQGWQKRAAYRKLPPGDQRQLLDDLSTVTYLRSEIANRASRRDPQLATVAATSRATFERLQAVGDSELLDRRLQAARYVAQRKFSEALPLLQALVKENPDDVAALLQLGNCHRALEHWSAAEGYYTACIALRPQSAFTYYFRGLLHLDAKDCAAARQDFDRALALDSDAPATLVNRGLAARGLGDHKAASEDFAKALELGCQQTRVWLLLSLSRAAEGDKAAAAAALDRWRAATPGDSLSWIARGTERLASDLPGAEAAFRAALELEPHSRIALQNLAHVLAERQHQNRAAIDLLTEALVREPRDSVLLGSRGVLYARTGEKELALTDARAAIKHSPESALAWYQLGCTYALLADGDATYLDRSLAALEKAVTREPTFAAAYEADRDLKAVSQDARFKNIVALGKRLASHPAP
jgi:serine/threonine protein kinase/predicted Zn-dependent protease